MPEDSGKPHRRLVRLKGCDYAWPGAYFVTICTWHKACLLGQVQEAAMVLNAGGRIAQQEWQRLPKRFPLVALDAFVIMPNHLHGLLILHACEPGGRGTGEASGARVLGETPRAPTGAGPVREAFGSPVPGSLPTIIRAYKSSVAWRIHRLAGYSGGPVWQRSFYEHVLRHEDDLRRTREYILANPQRWDETR